MTTKNPFHVIEGSKEQTITDKLKKARKANPAAISLLSCHRCGCNEVIETKVGMIVKNGKAQGGTRQYLCAGCFMKGDRVVLL